MSPSRWLKGASQRRRRDERGAALVESAIVLVPLCIIIFGIIEFGFIFKASLSISNASRAGARVGSAEPAQPDGNTGGYFQGDILNSVATAGTGVGFTTNVDHLWIYRAATTDGGFVGGTCSTDCTQYHWGGSSWVQDGSPGNLWTNAERGQADCLGQPMASLGVKLQVVHHSVTGFFGNFNGMKLTERTVMRLEPQTSCS